MASLTSLICIIFLVISIFYYLNQVSKSKLIRSNIDGLKYPVLDYPDKQEAADRLGFLMNQAKALIRYLKLRQGRHPSYKSAIQRLSSRFPPDSIREGKDGCSYLKDKGKALVLCLRNENNIFLPMKEMRKILVHELAHVASVSIGHDQEFQNNHKFLINQAAKFWFDKKL